MKNCFAIVVSIGQKNSLIGPKNDFEKKGLKTKKNHKAENMIA